MFLGTRPPHPAPAGQSIGNYRLILKHGAIVQVRINDAAGLLNAAALPAASAPHLLLGVMSARHIVEPLRPTALDASGRTQQGTVPLNRTSSLYVFAQGVRLADAGGIAIDPKGVNIPVTPGPAAMPVVFTFTVH
jgi:hypothetical protein